MSKWQKLKHRIQLATAYRWFLSLEKDIARMGIDDPSVVFDVGAHLGQTTLHFRSIFKMHTYILLNQSLQTLRK